MHLTMSPWTVFALGVAGVVLAGWAFTAAVVQLHIRRFRAMDPSLPLEARMAAARLTRGPLIASIVLAGVALFALADWAVPRTHSGLPYLAILPSVLALFALQLREGGRFGAALDGVRPAWRPFVRLFLLVILPPVAGVLLLLLLVFAGFHAMGWVWPSLSSGVRALVAALIGTLAVAWILPVLGPEALRLARRARPVDEGLRERIRALEDRAGVAVDGVYRMPGRLFGANAFATGMRPGRRLIFVTDELLDRLGPDEVMAVVAHELAHHGGGHLPRRLGRSYLLLPITMGAVLLVAALAPGTARAFPLATAGVGMFAALFVFQLVVLFPRVRANEHEADADAATWVSREAMASALAKLQAARAAGQPRTRLERTLATHPALDERVEHLEGPVRFNGR